MSHVTGFTFVVIGIVHLAGGKISEGIVTLFLRIDGSNCLSLNFALLLRITENLENQLRRMGLNDSDENHPLIDSTKQTLEALVQQR